MSQADPHLEKLWDSMTAPQGAVAKRVEGGSMCLGSWEGFADSA